MDENLREYFEQAVSDDPGADVEAMAHLAIARGGRVRRRRRQTAVAGVAAGMVAVLAVVTGVHLRSEKPGPASPTPAVAPTVAPAMLLVSASDCSAQPVAADATDVAMFAAPHVTDQQLSALRTTLEADPRVKTVLFESRTQAYERFQRLWAESPDFLASVGPDMLPESFRLRLVDPSQYSAFRAEYQARPDIDLIEGRVCETSAPVGGVQ
jgi:cell division transport system permease protein